MRLSLRGGLEALSELDRQRAHTKASISYRLARAKSQCLRGPVGYEDARAKELASVRKSDSGT